MTLCPLSAPYTPTMFPSLPPIFLSFSCSPTPGPQRGLRPGTLSWPIHPKMPSYSSMDLYPTPAIASALQLPMPSGIVVPILSILSGKHQIKDNFCCCPGQPSAPGNTFQPCVAISCLEFIVSNLNWTFITVQLATGHLSLFPQWEGVKAVIWRPHGCSCMF